MNKKSSRPIAQLLDRRRVLSPARMAVSMAFAIFACELVDMAVVYILPPLPKVLEGLIDSTLLITFLAPFYFLLYRPFWEERKRFEREIRLLSQNLICQSEDERKRVSAELHDQCGQTLTGLQFKIGSLQASMSEQPPPLKNQVQEIAQTISQLGDELRDVIYQLRPPILDDIGLVPALQNLISELSGQHQKIVFRDEYVLGGMKKKLSQEFEVVLYRICQESLNNVIKYAQASEVSVILRREKSQIVVIVRDNGVGFNAKISVVDSKKISGFGLLGMRERIAALNGELDIFSASGEGTTITATLPA